MADAFDFTDFLIGDDTELEFNASDFNLSTSVAAPDTRYIKPNFYSKPQAGHYKNAAELANAVRLAPGEQFHAIVKGNFIFGDFIEALIYEKNVTVKNMYISTLSMSQNNIDSLAGLLDDGRIEKLTLVLSNYFYSHEKHMLLPYLLKNIDREGITDILILRNHTKMVLMEISNMKIVLTGSSNLRSSECIEQFILQENAEAYEFYKNWFEDMRGYSIINHAEAKR